MTDPKRWSESYNEVIMNYSKITKKAVFVTEPFKDDERLCIAREMAKRDNIPLLKIDAKFVCSEI